MVLVHDSVRPLQSTNCLCGTASPGAVEPWFDRFGGDEGGDGEEKSESSTADGDRNCGGSWQSAAAILRHERHERSLVV